MTAVIDKYPFKECLGCSSKETCRVTVNGQYIYKKCLPDLFLSELEKQVSSHPEQGK